MRAENPVLHLPVLYHQVISALAPRSGGHYVDGTVGAGGHARGILEASSPDGQLLGFDLDPEALEAARATLFPYLSRTHLVHASYTQIAEKVAGLHWKTVDGILLDLGVSSIQLDRSDKGFSFRAGAPLDMRFNPTAGMTAADLVNTLGEEELLRILWEYGEEQHARRIVRQLLAARPVTTTTQLADLVQKAVPGKPRGIHPATKTFQALRIAVNHELENVASVLPASIALLAPAGRLAVITFHSLEDRIVKQYFQRESRDCLCPPEVPVCRCGHKAAVRVLKPVFIEADEAEIKANPRARSAKLRVVEKIELA